MSSAVYDSARQLRGDIVRHTRRDIVKTLAALPLVRLNRAEPDVVLYNGLVSTMNPGQPEATAIAIRDARFLAAGSDKDVLSLAGKRTRCIDLARRRVFPGFNDAHAQFRDRRDARRPDDCRGTREHQLLELTPVG